MQAVGIIFQAGPVVLHIPKDHLFVILFLVRFV
jgi:hypothetical protein